MDFNIPPKYGLKSNLNLEWLDFTWIHQDRDTRFKFYRQIVMPTGHCFIPYNNDALILVSQEFHDAVETKDITLQAWVKLVS